MKILIAHPFPFSAYKGGAERYCENLKKGLSTYKDISVSQINGNYFELFGEPFPTIKILQIIKKIKPDIIHLHGPSPYATITGFFGKILGIKTILTYYAPLNPENVFKMVAAAVDRTFLRYVFDYLTIISEDYRGSLENFFPPNKIKLTPLLLEDSFFGYPKTKEECRRGLLLGSEKIVLFIGKMDKHHYYKGVVVLIEAVKGVSPEVEFILIGDGEKKKDYERLAFKEGVEKRLSFVGEVDQESLMKYYRASDLLILPSTSDSEGFGYVLFEAMAMGIPIITTDVVGSARLIKEGEAGLVIPPNNPLALSEGIKGLLNSTPLYKRIKENGRKLAEEFRTRKVIGKVLEVYREAVKKTRE